MKSQWPANTGNSMEPRHYQGQALRVCAMRTALTEPSLPAHPESGKGDGAAGAHPLTSGGAQVLGLIFKELPTNSADEAKLQQLHAIHLFLVGILY